MALPSATAPLRIAVLALAGALAVGTAGCDSERTPDKRVAVGGGAPEPPVAAASAPPRATAPSPGAAPQAVDDASLSARVQSKVVAEAGAAGLAIDVRSNDGVVTLLGTVDAPDIRERAARAASAVDGVKAVDNRIVVARAP